MQNKGKSVAEIHRSELRGLQQNQILRVAFEPLEILEFALLQISYLYSGT